MHIVTVSLFHVLIDEHIQMQHRRGEGGGVMTQDCLTTVNLPENEGRRFLQNVCTLPTNYTTLHARRQKY